MKILILANNDVGLYQFRRELIEALAKDNEVSIALPYGKLVEPLKEICTFHDTPMERRGMNPMKDAKLLLQYRKLVKKEKPDLVVTYTIKPNIYGGIVSRFLRKPYAVNITGLGTVFQKKGAALLLVKLLYKLSLKKAKVIFFENLENMQTMLSMGLAKEEKCCLLNGAGVNLDTYRPQEYPKTQDVTKFLFVGRVMAEKGIDELIEATKKLRSEGQLCELDVVGGLEEDYKQKLEECAGEGWLRYHGYQEDVKPFIKSCHCFVLPSWHEGMANTNLESAASARPIIISNIHGCKEAVVDGESGLLCEKQNVDSLYEAMKRFIELPTEAKKEMGLRGRAHMEDVFDKNKVVEETIRHLNL